MRLLAIALALGVTATPAADNPWTELFNGTDTTAWKTAKGWQVAGSVKLDPENPKKLLSESGTGLLIAVGKGGEDLTTKQQFRDVEVHCEFLVAKGSNSGVKLMGLYEIQILDRPTPPKEPTGDATGGIYPRAEQAPKYHHIDKGFPPLVKADKPAGEWQTLEIVFRAPRFDSAGKKTANAAFELVSLNGQIVQKGRDLGTPTGHAHVKKEIATGPILLQGDHGPVAFRNVRVRAKAD